MDKSRKDGGCSALFSRCLLGGLLGGVLSFLPATVYVVSKQKTDPRAGGSGPMGGAEIYIIMVLAAAVCGLLGTYIVWRRSQK